MARTCKQRRICGEPRCRRFGPFDFASNQSQSVILSLDEFECIRLIDYEGLTQEQCAEQMDVARTTVQAIYKSGREKMADSLVNGKELYISGGNVRYCETKEHCWRRHCSGHISISIPEGGHNMRIAVTYENGKIFQHFGHTEQFKIYDIEDGAVAAAAVVNTNGSGHGALAGFLKERQVDVLICGGIGGGAQNALAQAGIKLFGGVSGDPDAAVEALLKEALVYNPNVKCNHHHHEDGEHGNCGNHGCGSHSCGGH